MEATKRGKKALERKYGPKLGVKVTRFGWGEWRRLGLGFGERESTHVLTA